MNQDPIVNTLVIGGAGYIGSHLVPQLVNIGRKVTVLGRSSSPRYELPADVDYVLGDFTQYELICDLLDQHEEVIHLAYATVPNTSFDDPLADLTQNLLPTVQLFSEMALRGTKLLLVSSGGTVYGEAAKIAIAETHQTKPISPYGVTKLTLENYAYLYAATHGLKFVCIRPSNAYGVGQLPFIGQGFISTAISSVMKEMPVKIFGKCGTIRDYLYVSDVASGIVSALQSGRLSEIYNLGSGSGLSNLEVMDMLKPLMLEIGHSLEIEYLPERSFDVKYNILDSTKLYEDTGWVPVVSTTEGLKLTRDWLSNKIE